MNKILIVDDDRTILDVLKYNLVKERYTVATAEDGMKALERARQDKPDLIILDIMLPGLDGFEVCRILRKEMAVPILMLTARTEEIDKVVGLELGADDYMTKPFSIRELMTRIKAMLRRSQWLEQQPPSIEEAALSVLKGGNIEVDLVAHRVLRDGSLITLTPKEFDLLSLLMRRQGQVFSRALLVDKIWGSDYKGHERTIDVHMHSLRQKIETDPKNPKHLLTIYGLGYKFEGRY